MIESGLYSRQVSTNETKFLMICIFKNWKLLKYSRSKRWGLTLYNNNLMHHSDFYNRKQQQGVIAGFLYLQLAIIFYLIDSSFFYCNKQICFILKWSTALIWNKRVLKTFSDPNLYFLLLPFRFLRNAQSSVFFSKPYGCRWIQKSKINL